MFENPLDPVWLVAGAALAAVFGLAGLVLAIYAVRRRRPVLGVVLGVLAVAANPAAARRHWRAVVGRAAPAQIEFAAASNELARLGP